ncbi:MAG: hypothetical protein QM731_18570 [Chitinophagaceae bacterium]
MKNIFLSLMLLVTVGNDTANAQDKISVAVKDAFKKEFAGARLLECKRVSKENVYRLRFTNDTYMFSAFFEEDGTLLGTGRVISESVLPLMISRYISASYQGYDIKCITEYNDTAQTSYLVEMENEKRKQVVRIYNNGDCMILKKEKKVSK